jgi:hypothetical protein
MLLACSTHDPAGLPVEQWRLPPAVHEAAVAEVRAARTPSPAQMRANWSCTDRPILAVRGNTGLRSDQRAPSGSSAFVAA